MGTKAAVLTSGPIGFTDSRSGGQLSIPGSAIYFDNTGAVKADQWPLYVANQVIIDAWLPYLAQRGVILPAPTAPSAPAMVIKAKAPGSSGNFIQIGFSNIRPDPNHSGVDIFDVTVTETNTYTLLTPSTIKEILGTAPSTGKQPGLVYVSSAGDPKLPKAGEYTLSGDPATRDIDKNAGTDAAFTVNAKSSGDDGARTKVTIKDVDSNANTFTLVATWTKTVEGIEVKVVEINFAYELTVSPPEGSTTLAVPAPGTITLSGGADTTSAVPASVTVAANS